MKNESGDRTFPTSPGSWSFAGGLAKGFNQHITKSVPDYIGSHQIIALASDFFLSPGSRCVDIGCSTGTLLAALEERHRGKKISFVGLDTEEPMISFARDTHSPSEIDFQVASALEADLSGTMVISAFTMQFIHPSIRQLVVDRVFESLTWGGGFFLFEKVRGSDARFQDIFTSIHLEWKLEQGFTEGEVFGKWRSLKGIMEPFSDFGNRSMLERAGFRDIETIWKWGPFQGYLAIK